LSYGRTRRLAHLHRGPGLTLFLFVRRWYNLHSEQIGTRDFLTGITNVLQRGNMPEAISICEDTPGPVPQIVRAALLKADDSLQEIHTAIQQAGMVELPRLESKLGFFSPPSPASRPSWGCWERCRHDGPAPAAQGGRRWPPRWTCPSACIRR
jgi:hypothetical protein